MAAIPVLYQVVHSHQRCHCILIPHISVANFPSKQCHHELDLGTLETNKTYKNKTTTAAPCLVLGTIGGCQWVKSTLLLQYVTLCCRNHHCCSQTSLEVKHCRNPKRRGCSFFIAFSGVLSCCEAAPSLHSVLVLQLLGVALHSNLKRTCPSTPPLESWAQHAVTNCSHLTDLAQTEHRVGWIGLPYWRSHETIPKCFHSFGSHYIFGIQGFPVFSLSGSSSNQSALVTAFISTEEPLNVLLP